MESFTKGGSSHAFDLDKQVRSLDKFGLNLNLLILSYFAHNIHPSIIISKMNEEKELLLL